ncbi:hypothetical protein [Serratia fonticola]|uniref:Secreted protein n=1 Tax=Serratia fonticola TaxID=47917 RepID=A0ABY9PIA0_SERFO|nr:hypothetical protein [Serratia fonticola]WMT13136.1 hypothetical protein RFB13_18100 [Serratia fonticola]
MNNLKALFVFLLLATPAISYSAAQCGNFKFTVDSAGKGIINGEQVTSQKTTFLGPNGDWNQIKLDMTIMPASDGRMYGFEFIKQNGKAFLNVELIRRDMDAPRLIGSFDCKKIPD